MMLALRQRGTILLEILLSMTLFLMAALAILTAVGQGRKSLEDTHLLQQAADHARSAMAKLESGIEDPATMSGPIEAWSEGDEVMTDAPEDSGWMLEVDTSPSQFTGLTVVEVEAYREDLVTGERRATFRLTQLVRLGDLGDDIVGEQDDILGATNRGGGS